MSKFETGEKSNLKNYSVNRRNMLLGGTTLAAASALGSAASVQKAQAQPVPSGERPNIIVIMGDDIGWSNIGVYNQGIMAGRTPNLDRMASEGMRFTDFDAMEDPFHRNYPPTLLNTVGPRNLVHCVATDVDDPTVDPRWGR